MNKLDSKAKMRTCMVRMVVCVLRQLFEVNAGQHIWRLLNKAVVCWIVCSVHVCVSISLLLVFEDVCGHFTVYCVVYLLCINTHTKVWASRINTSKKKCEHQRDQLSFPLTEYDCKHQRGILWFLGDVKQTCMWLTIKIFSHRFRNRV